MRSLSTVALLKPCFGSHALKGFFLNLGWYRFSFASLLKTLFYYYFATKKKKSAKVSSCHSPPKVHTRKHTLRERQPTPEPVMPTHTLSQSPDASDLRACTSSSPSVFNEPETQRLILFNYEFHTCIIDGLIFFLCFFVFSEPGWGAGVEWRWFSSCFVKYCLAQSQMSSPIGGRPF